MGGERKSDQGIFNLKYLAAFVIALGVIAAPFMAVGGFKERMIRLELDRDAQAAEIKVHEKEDTNQQIVLAGSLASINTTLQNLNTNMEELKHNQTKIFAKTSLLRSTEGT